MRRIAVPILFIVFAASCSDEGTPLPGGSADSGVFPDARVVPDPEDAGTHPDAAADASVRDAATTLNGIPFFGSDGSVNGSTGCGPEEICNNGLDDDCDESIDENCLCIPGPQPCYTGFPSQAGVGVCTFGTQTCTLVSEDRVLGPCEGEGRPQDIVCGSGLDSHCNGIIDEGCTCSPGQTRACYDGPSSTRGVGLCHDGVQTCSGSGSNASWGPCEGQALPAAQNSCDGLDHLCNNDPSAGCDCVIGQTRACYDGPAGTQDVGLCHAGNQTCVDNAGTPQWSPCEGQVLPTPNTCDGVNRICVTADVGCECSPGQTRACYDGPVGTQGVGICQAGSQTCVSGPGGVGSSWGTCDGQVLPGTNVCDGVDRLCDGHPENGCTCFVGQTRACYDGPAQTRGVGACQDGTQTCVGQGTWGGCGGQTLPAGQDTCGNNVDDDCTGNADEGCAICGNARVDQGEACDDGNGNANDGCENNCQWTVLVISPPDREVRPNGNAQFVVISGTPGPYNWEVNGTVGGTSTYGTVDANGLYHGPATVPSPATFTICAVDQNFPNVRGCAQITVVVVFSPGEDVVVFNDGNPFDDYALQDPNNVTMVTNLLVYPNPGARASANVVRISANRSTCLAPYDCPGFGSTFAAFGNLVSSLGLSLEVNANSIEAIDASVRVLFIPMPLSPFTIPELNGLKAFAAEGGRIVVIGEHSQFYAGIQFENQLLVDLGAQLSNVGDTIDCNYNVMPGSSLRAHQITTGMNQVTIACSSQVILGPNDQPLYYDSSNTRVLTGVAKIDLNPI